MSDTAVDSLVLDLVACDRGYVERALSGDIVPGRVTPAGLEALKEHRPKAYEGLHEST